MDTGGIRPIPPMPKPESTHMNGKTYRMERNGNTGRWEYVRKPKRWYHRWLRINPGYEIETGDTGK